jgi:hypothetical protein
LAPAANTHACALRGGVNLVMITLTSNDKSGQVFMPDVLERLAYEASI